MAGSQGGSQAALARALGLEAESAPLCAGGLPVARGNGLHLPFPGPTELAVPWFRALRALSDVAPRFWGVRAPEDLSVAA